MRMAFNDAGGLQGVEMDVQPPILKPAREGFQALGKKITSDLEAGDTLSDIKSRFVRFGARVYPVAGFDSVIGAASVHDMVFQVLERASSPGGDDPSRPVLRLVLGGRG
ncbi:MAG: hypothetical protein H6865_06840 [Rhodospirillales bacterium]|nr:hypothetical protein [Alphaproteobacteria bacterium]MCB9987332.1 hypothetical protein [Rhodospirillales bacterium]USO07815.1 MAG: hypothetical protein H6866_00860 [Rhodospirillales bacterium]